MMCKRHLAPSMNSALNYIWISIIESKEKYSSSSINNTVIQILTCLSFKEWGAHEVYAINGTPSDIIKEVESGRADLGIGDITITDAREKVSLLARGRLHEQWSASRW